MKNPFHLGQGQVRTLHQLFIDQLKDLYDAETQLTEALPKMAEAAHNPELKQGFEMHLDETRGHLRRIEEIFQELEEGKMAGYGTVRTFAEIMGHENAANLLQATLDEESATDEKLTMAAEKINADIPIGH